jgi:multidrug resistance efflux pump
MVLRLVAIAVLVAVVGGLGFFFGMRSAGPKDAQPNVPVTPPETASENGQIQLMGTVQSANPVEILPDTSGVLQSLHVRKGDAVKEGDLLAIVRNEAFEAVEQRLAQEYQALVVRVEESEKSVSQARVEIARMKSEVESSSSRLAVVRQEADRQRQLHAEGATSRLKFEESQRDLENAERQHRSLEQVLATAEAQLVLQEQSLNLDRQARADKQAEWEAAKGDVGLGEVLAPVEGIVTEIRMVEGADVGPNAEPMMEIAPTDAVRYAVLEPTETQMRRIRVGQPALLRPQSLSDVRELPGTVFGFRGPEVLVEFIDENNRVPPGSRVQVVIETAGDEIARLLLPSRP